MCSLYRYRSTFNPSHKSVAAFWRFGIDKLESCHQRHHRIAHCIFIFISISISISYSYSPSSWRSGFGCCCSASLISVAASRLCQTCVSVCGNTVSWVFRSCLVNVVADVAVSVIISSSTASGASQFSAVCPGRLECCDAADDAPYMLSMLSALRLKSAMGAQERERETEGEREMWKMLMGLAG